MINATARPITERADTPAALPSLPYWRAMEKAMKQEKSEYAKKFLDPRWQKKRLDVLNRDDFTCQKCFDEKSTLHVHHIYYLGQSDPWSYPNSALITLCADCHEAEEIERREAERRLLLAVKRAVGMSGSMNTLAEAFEAIAIEENAHPEYDSAPVAVIAWHIKRLTLLLREHKWAGAIGARQGEFFDRYWKPFDEDTKGFRYFPTESSE